MDVANEAAGHWESGGLDFSPNFIHGAPREPRQRTSSLWLSVHIYEMEQFIAWRSNTDHKRQYITNFKEPNKWDEVRDSGERTVGRET